MTPRKRTTPSTKSTAAQAADVLESLLDSIEDEELAANGEQIARLQGAQAVLMALSQLQDTETLSPPPAKTSK